MNKIDFTNIEYLKWGNEKQRVCYKILKEINIFELLKDYSPILVGTIPIDIDIDNSDLDIVCKINNIHEFEKLLSINFSKYINYRCTKNLKENIIICNFEFDNIEIEIYASNIDSKKSNGYRHMIVEHNILSLNINNFKNKIMELKEAGLKTEPAFAKVLNLKGNPYEEMLKLEKYNDIELFDLISNNLSE